MYYVCFLTVLAVVFMILWLVFRYLQAERETAARLEAVEKGQADVQERVARLEKDVRQERDAGQEKQSAPAKTAGTNAIQPLSGERALAVEEIAQAVRALGYEPDVQEDCLVFQKGDETLVIDTDRLPRWFFVRMSFLADPKDWDFELLQRAAHRMSDDLIMVKADISEEADAEGCRVLRIFLAAMDRTSEGLRENLPNYIDILERGQQRMTELYNEYEKEKEDSSSLNKLTEASSRQTAKKPS